MSLEVKLRFAIRPSGGDGFQHGYAKTLKERKNNTQQETPLSGATQTKQEDNIQTQKSHKQPYI